MGPILLRVVLLAGGLALGEVGLTSLAGGQAMWIVQLGLSLVLLVAGSVGFMGPLLGQSGEEGGSDG